MATAPVHLLAVVREACCGATGVCCRPIPSLGSERFLPQRRFFRLRRGAIRWASAFNIVSCVRSVCICADRSSCFTNRRTVGINEQFPFPFRHLLNPVHSYPSPTVLEQEWAWRLRVPNGSRTAR